VHPSRDRPDGGVFFCDTAVLRGPDGTQAVTVELAELPAHPTDAMQSTFDFDGYRAALEEHPDLKCLSLFIMFFYDDYAAYNKVTVPITIILTAGDKLRLHPVSQGCHDCGMRPQKYHPSTFVITVLLDVLLTTLHCTPHCTPRCTPRCTSHCTYLLFTVLTVVLTVLSLLHTLTLRCITRQAVGT
jgi:hypothetical protein